MVLSSLMTLGSDYLFFDLLLTKYRVLISLRLRQRFSELIQYFKYERIIQYLLLKTCMEAQLQQLKTGDRSQRIKEEFDKMVPLECSSFFENFFSQCGQRPKSRSERKTNSKAVVEVWVRSEISNTQLSSQTLNALIKRRSNFLQINNCSVRPLDNQTIDEAWDRIVTQFSAQNAFLRIKIQQCRIKTPHVKSICMRNPNLIWLDLRHNQITDEGVRMIAAYTPNILTLCLRNNYVTDSGAMTIAQFLLKLKKLYLGANYVSDQGAKSISYTLNQLTILYLWGNRVGNQGALAIVSNLPKLKQIFLDQNIISDMTKLLLHSMLSLGANLNI